jgi:hypothetical protein
MRRLCYDFIVNYWKNKGLVVLGVFSLLVVMGISHFGHFQWISRFGRF